MVEKEDKGTLLVCLVDQEPGVIGSRLCLIMKENEPGHTMRKRHFSMKQTDSMHGNAKEANPNREGEISFHTHGKPRATLLRKCVQHWW